MRRDDGSRDGEVESDESTKPGCCELDTGTSFVRRAESSLYSDNPGRIGVRVNQSVKKVPIAVIEVTNLTMWEENVTAE